jgi:peptidoglycan/LPS O-acetylase OafA/YrhL
LHDASLRSGFDPRIESLRGVAALSVVLTHSVAVLRIDGVAAYWTIPFWEQSPAAQATTLLGAIFNPGAAVVLFFVLSGYVLGLSLRREDGPLRDRLGTYLWRRGFRLLPAMWASILLYALVLQLIAFTAPRELFSDWYVAMFGALRGWHAMARNFVLVDSNANPVTWTMYVEVIGSLAVPLLYAWHRGRTAAAGVLVLVVLIVVAALWPSSVTLRYLFCFDIGVMLACHPGLARAVPRPGLALGAAMLLFATDRLALAPYPRLDLFADALGSTLLLAGLLGSAGRGPFVLLERAPLRFLGRISYSLYLFHPLVLYPVGQLVATQLPPGVLANALVVVAGIAISIALAAVTYELIEAPMIRLGRSRLARRPALGGAETVR